MTRVRTLCYAALFVITACDDGAAEKAAPKDAKPAVAAPETSEKPKADLPDAAKLLADVVEAEGGAARFDAIKTFSFEMTVEVPGSGLGGTGKVWWKGGDFYQELTMPGVGTTRMGKSGAKIWSIDPIQGSREVTGKEAAVYEMAASLNLANDWKKYFDRAETKSVEEVGGKKFAEIELSSAKSGLSVAMRIDVGEGRVVARRMKQATPLGEIPVEETLEDYRQQDGLWFSFRQTADMKLQKMRTTVTKLELDVPVDETKFVQPGPELVVDPKAPPVTPPTDAKAPADVKKPANGKAPADPLGKVDPPKPGKGERRQVDPLAGPG